MSKDSAAWKLVPVAGAVKEGTPGTAPSPVTLKLRTLEKAESIEPCVPPTVCDALTHQKYDPSGRPLTVSWLRTGMPGRDSWVNPDAMIVVNVLLVPTSHVYLPIRPSPA